MLILQYALVVVLGLLPSIIWLIFFEREEADHLESAGDLVYAFLLGVATTFAALIVQLSLVKFVMPASFSAHLPLGITLFSAIEEILKFFAVYLLIRHRRAFAEPLDAMIFMITVALGFAAVENVATLINQGGVALAFGSPHALEVVTLRFLGATLLHCVASGTVGFHWAVGWIRGRRLWLQLAIGLCIATILHAVFNYLILATGPASWAVVFAAGIAFFLIIDFEELRVEEVTERAAGMSPPRLP